MPRPSPRGAPPAGLFRDLLLDPERERIPEARPVVSFRDDDDPAFLRELRNRALRTVELVRRGVWHGEVAELDPRGLLPPRPRRRRREVIRAQRWRAAQPIYAPGAVEPPASIARESAALYRGLSEAAGLRAWLAPRVAVSEEDAELFDPERDLARCVLAEGDDLWAKTGRLSAHPEDRSLRLRFSFGREGDDDASRDEKRHRAVGELGAQLLPGATAVVGDAELRAALGAASGLDEVHFTQPIAYWNAPNGGARFHHDAFADDDEGGQRGVCYAQLTGGTLWLALSIEELGARVREFVGYLADGELAWLREELAASDAAFGELREIVSGRDVLLHELARPDCGALGRVVNRGPEFTAFLADAGHALWLDAGDVLLLPNHGLARTAMHSVFCAGDFAGYGLSFALRAGI